MTGARAARAIGAAFAIGALAAAMVALAPTPGLGGEGQPEPDGADGALAPDLSALVPATWQPLPTLVDAARAAGAVDATDKADPADEADATGARAGERAGIAPTDVRAWGDPATGCFAVAGGVRISGADATDGDSGGDGAARSPSLANAPSPIDADPAVRAATAARLHEALAAELAAAGVDVGERVEPRAAQSADPAAPAVADSRAAVTRAGRSGHPETAGVVFARSEVNATGAMTLRWVTCFHTPREPAACASVCEAIGRGAFAGGSR